MTYETQAPQPLALPELSPEALAQRKALVATILENRKHRVIAPLTTTDLVHLAREDETWYGTGR